MKINGETHYLWRVVDREARYPTDEMLKMRWRSVCRVVARQGTQRPPSDARRIRMETRDKSVQKLGVERSIGPTTGPVCFV